MAEETSGAVDPLVTTVTDDDAESNYMAHAEQAARDAAAQRRQKILQKAQERMSIVEGTYSSNKAVEDTTTPDGTEAPEAPSTASRLAAMRRRRFKKSAAAVEPVVPTEEEAAAPTASTAEEPAAVVTPVFIPEEEAVSAEMPSLMKEASVEKEAIDSVQNAVVPPEENAPSLPKKKYLGVAKMRRRMIQERHPEASSTERVEEEVPVTALPKLKKQRSLVTTLPIAMYLVTTLLLFLTGLNIGLQQSTVDYCHDGGADVCTVVPSELAPRSLGGLQRILSLMDDTTAAVPKKVIKPSVATPEWQEALQTEEEDEFAENGASTQSSNDNIDPVFGVDLDQYTQGDGIYFVLAQFAVRVHRWNLAVVYYVPRSFYIGLSSFVASLIQFPPILFLLAMAIRQVMGKIVLGAKLPEKIVDATQHKDIVSSIQTFVSNWFSSSFPTAVTFYDIYTHLRSDMYVVLCGLLVGWAWSHRHQAGSPYGVPRAVLESALGGVSPPLDDERRDEL